MSRPFISIDPAQRFGRPHIRGRTVEILAGHVWAGDSVESVCEDYEVTRPEVLLACWFTVEFTNAEQVDAWHRWARDAEPHLAKGEYLAIPDPPSKEDR